MTTPEFTIYLQVLDECSSNLGDIKMFLYNLESIFFHSPIMMNVYNAGQAWRCSSVGLT